MKGSRILKCKAAVFAAVFACVCLFLGIMLSDWYPPEGISPDMAKNGFMKEVYADDINDGSGAGYAGDADTQGVSGRIVTAVDNYGASFYRSACADGRVHISTDSFSGPGPDEGAALLSRSRSASAEVVETDGMQGAVPAGEAIFTDTAAVSVITGEKELLREFARAYFAENPAAFINTMNAAEVCEDDYDALALDEVDALDPLSADAVFLSYYEHGVRDRSVAYIQQQLMNLGFMESAEPTEYYGSITMEAVKRFQRQNGLEQNGVMGSEALAMLMSPDAKTYLLKQDMHGEDILEVQNRLYELGYLEDRNSIDGYYGPHTVEAVKAMQEANGLAVDGMIGLMSFELLYSDEIKANVLSFGDHNETIKICQERLKDLGYLTTEPDGSYGNDTLAAVKLFQNKNGIVVDGYLGPATRDLLLSDSAIPNGLTIGDEGDTVKRIQKLLIKYGYLGADSATGYYGEVTEKAVKLFQSYNGLSVDGNLGRKTMAVLTGDSPVTAAEGAAALAAETVEVTVPVEEVPAQDGENEAETVETVEPVDSGDGGAAVEGADTEAVIGGSVDELIAVAMTKLGCKYSWGAKGPNKFDCSGFVYWCLNQIGVKQSYITSYGWRTIGKYKKITKLSQVKAGDIIVCYGHVGIASYDGTVIDASSSRQQIVCRSISSWWRDNFYCAWRIFD